MSRLVSVPALLRRLDDQAYEQLVVEAARLAGENERLAEENERLRVELVWADQAAESWRDDALRMMEERCAATGERPGITITGQLVTVPQERAS